MIVNNFVQIGISAGIGTLLAELIIKLVLSHWLKKRFYVFKLKLQDKQGCADEIISLLNDPQVTDWTTDIHSRANLLSDKLLTMKQKDASKLLDQFSSKHLYISTIVKNMIYNPDSSQDEERIKDYIERSGELDDIRTKLVEVAEKLKS